MSDKDLRKKHDDLRSEFNELRLTVIDYSGRIAKLEQDAKILNSYVDQLKRDLAGR